jgi:hypothetical protein
MAVLNISINNKVATFHKRGGGVVCRNTDYVIAFTFDSEWEGYENKTARFIWGGRYQDVPIEGTTCVMPEVYRTESVKVGVYAGDLSTTTPAVIPCQASVLCEADEPHDEEARPNINEAKEAAEKATQAAGAAAEAAATADVAATEATEAAETAQEAATEAKRAAASVSSLRGEKAGSSVVLDDIAPAPNVVTVSVESKNLVPLVYHQNWNGNNPVTIRGIVFTTNEDGSITMNGTFDGTGNISFFLVSSSTKPFVLKKGTYISGTGLSYASLSYMTVDGKYGGFYHVTLEEETKFQYLYLSMQKSQINGKTFNGETIYPMLMRGTVLEEYTEPVAAGTAVTMTCGEEEIETSVGETVELVDVAQGATITTDNEAVALYAEYHRDINKAFEELRQAIISLGGNV